MTLVCAMILMIGMSGFFVAMGCRIIPISPTSGRIVIMFLLMALLAALNFHSSLLLIKAHSLLHLGKIPLFYAVVFALPAMAFASGLPMLLVNQIRAFGRLGSVERGKEIPGAQFVSQTVWELGHWLDLEKPVAIIYSERNNVCPYAVGRGLRGGAVVLPAGFYEISLNACNRDDGLTRELIKLILAHELAHIRDRDVLLVPALITTAGLFLWVLALALLASCLNAWFGFDATVKLLQPRIAMVMLPGFLMLLWILRGTITMRESLADEAASKLVKRETLDRLVSPPAGSAVAPSPLEAFVVGVRLANWWSHSFLGVRMTRPLDRIVNFMRRRSGGDSVAEFRSRNRDRFQPPTRGQLEERDVMCQAGAMFSAVFLGAFLFAGFQSSALQDFQSFWIEQARPSSGPGGEAKPSSGSYLVAVERWGTRLAVELEQKLPRMLASLLIAIVILVVSWPAYKGILNHEYWSPARRVGGIAGAFFLLFVGFNLFVGLLGAERMPGVPEFSYLRPRKETVVLWLFVASWFLGVIALLREGE